MDHGRGMMRTSDPPRPLHTGALLLGPSAQVRWWSDSECHATSARQSAGGTPRQPPDGPIRAPTSNDLFHSPCFEITE